MNKKKNDLNSIVLFRLFLFAIKFKFWFFGCIIISILLSLVSSYKPILTSEAIDLGIIKKNNLLLLMKIILISILTVFEVLFQYFLAVFSNLIAQNVIYDFRIKMYEKLIYFKIPFFDRTPNGVLITRAVSDVETISTIYNDGILMIFGDILRIGFVVIAMFYVNWILGIISFIMFPIMYFFTSFFQNALKKAFIDERNASSQLNSFIQERLNGMNIIQLFNRIKIESQKFQYINNKLTKSHLKTIFFFSIFFPIIELITSLSISIVIFTGTSMLLYKLKISPGEIVAFIIFINMLMRPIRQIADRFNQMQRGIVGAERVLKLIDNIKDSSLNSKGFYDHSIQGKITFKNVDFSYIKNQKILKNISFEIIKGDSIAIVGKTGSGKSTISNLLIRFYEIENGEILIDDIPLKKIKITNLREQISIILQDVFLFNDSILKNITFGDSKISIEQVKKAAKEIGIHKFIENLPEGYLYKVDQRGNSLSYGQKQLIAFLRVYIRNPAILIFDEATSSIDTNTEILIQKAIKKIMKNRTVIIIAHRLATIQEVKKIMVLNTGNIIEQGTHKELLKNKSTYYNLYQKQFK